MLMNATRVGVLKVRYSVWDFMGAFIDRKPTAEPWALGGLPGFDFPFPALGEEMAGVVEENFHRFGFAVAARDSKHGR